MDSWRGALALDDWGLSPAVNEAILRLAERGLVGSVSVLVNLPHWRHGLAGLEALGVELELHWNFTLGRPVLGAPLRSLTGRDGRFLPLGALLARAAAGRVSFAEVSAEAGAQLALFDGLRVSRVNGHQHLHLVPGFAGALAGVARASGIQEVRWVEDSRHWPTLLLRPFSARAWRGFRRHAVCVLHPTRARTPGELLEARRRAAGRRIVAHPAARDDFAGLEFADSLRAERVREFECLRGLEP